MTLLGLLAVVRVMASIPLPGPQVDMFPLFSQNPYLALLDLFAGGAMSRFSILALAAYPYLIARLLLPLLFPEFHDEINGYSLNREQWERRVRIATAMLAIALGFFYLYSVRLLGIELSVNFLTSLTMVGALAAGTLLLVWVGDLALGLEIIIAGNILAALPRYLLADTEAFWILAFALLTIAIAVGGYLLVSRAQRRVPVVTYGRMLRKPGENTASRTYIPLPLNSSGLAPLFFLVLVFAIVHFAVEFLGGSESGLVGILAGIGGQLTDTDNLLFWLLFLLLGFIAKIFYGLMREEDVDYAENLKRTSGGIAGISSGRRTRDYLLAVLLRTAWVEPAITMALLTLPAIIYYGLFGGQGIWPILLVAVLYVVRPEMRLIEAFRAEIRLTQFRSII